MANTINTEFFRHIVDSAQLLLGRDVIQHCQKSTFIDLSNHRIPIHQVYGFLSLLKQYYGPRPLGLDIAKGISPSSFSMVGHLLVSSKSLGESLELVSQYYPYIMDSECVSFTVNEHTASFRGGLLQVMSPEEMC